MWFMFENIMGSGDVTASQFLSVIQSSVEAWAGYVISHWVALSPHRCLPSPFGFAWWKRQQCTVASLSCPHDRSILCSKRLTAGYFFYWLYSLLQNKSKSVIVLLAGPHQSAGRLSGHTNNIDYIYIFRTHLALDLFGLVSLRFWKCESNQILNIPAIAQSAPLGLDLVK